MPVTARPSTFEALLGRLNRGPRAQGGRAATQHSVGGGVSLRYVEADDHIFIQHGDSRIALVRPDNSCIFTMHGADAPLRDTILRSTRTVFPFETLRVPNNPPRPDHSTRPRQEQPREYRYDEVTWLAQIEGEEFELKDGKVFLWADPFCRKAKVDELALMGDIAPAVRSPLFSFDPNVLPGSERRRDNRSRTDVFNDPERPVHSEAGFFNTVGFVRTNLASRAIQIPRMTATQNNDRTWAVQWSVFQSDARLLGYSMEQITSCVRPGAWRASESGDMMHYNEWVDSWDTPATTGPGSTITRLPQGDLNPIPVRSGITDAHLNAAQERIAAYRNAYGAPSISGRQVFRVPVMDPEPNPWQVATAFTEGLDEYDDHDGL